MHCIGGSLGFSGTPRLVHLCLERNEPMQYLASWVPVVLQEKSGSLAYRQTKGMALWDPSDIPLNLIGPPGPPSIPFGPLNIPLDPIGPLRSPALPYK